jgi:DNA (cytosine-5)-methyltransferase 1
VSDTAHYYNEFSPYPARWLRNLSVAGLIPSGHVDERDIRTVLAGDVAAFRQCHWFAGVGGWPLALRLAGWPVDRFVWTASCPCQPFSGAGKKKGHADARHLWPDLFRILRECRPPVVFGEQVASPDGLLWLDGVFADLEGEGYACWAVDCCAAGVASPHIRQRLYWVADRSGDRLERCRESAGQNPERPSERRGRQRPSLNGPSGGLADADGAQRRADGGGNADRSRAGGDAAVGPPGGRGAACGLAHAVADGRHQQHGVSRVETVSGVGRDQPAHGRRAHWLANSQSRGRVQRPSDDGGGVAGVPTQGKRGRPADDCHAGGLGFPLFAGPQGHAGHVDNRDEPGRDDADAGGPVAPAGANAGPWSNFIVIPCRDGKARRVGAQPGDEPLAYGLPARVGPGVAGLVGLDDVAGRAALRRAKSNRVGRIAGYGNAIVPLLAAEFVANYLEGVPA